MMRKFLIVLSLLALGAPFAGRAALADTLISQTCTNGNPGPLVNLYLSEGTFTTSGITYGLNKRDLFYYMSGYCVGDNVVDINYNLDTTWLQAFEYYIQPPYAAASALAAISKLQPLTQCEIVGTYQINCGPIYAVISY